MNSIFDIVTQPLAFILNICYNLTGSYLLSIVIFTFLIRLLLFPSAIKAQRGQAKQLRMRPKIKRIQEKYKTNRAKMQEETTKLQQSEGNSMTAGCLPQLIQFPIMIGLYQVIYSPLTYILRLSNENIITPALNFLGTLTDQAGNAISKTELNIIYNLDKIAANVPAIAEYKDQITSFKSGFSLFGLDLTESPNINQFSAIWIIPALTFISSMAVSFVMYRNQKKNNPEMAGPASGCMLFVMPLISLIFVFSMSAGVGFYYIVSNIVSMLQTIMVNKFYSPRSMVAELYIDETIQRRSKEEYKKKKTGETGKRIQV